MHNTRSSQSSFPFCLSALDKETEWEYGIEEAFLRRSFSLDDLGSNVQLTLRRLCDKLSSSYYCTCNCYFNRDSYMKCNNNNNNIVFVFVVCCNSFAFVVSLYNLHALSAWHTLHSSSLPFSLHLSSLFCSVNACKFPTLCGEFAQQLQSSTVSVGSLSSRSACKLCTEGRVGAREIEDNNEEECKN